MGMILYRIALFAVATLAFVTLYDFGPADFPKNVAAEFETLKSWVQAPTGH